MRRSAASSVAISRTGYTGDLGYEIWMDAERCLGRVGRAHGTRVALWHHPRRHAGTGHRAHRSWADPARRGLRLRAQGDDSRAAFVALRALVRLDRRDRQADRSTASAPRAPRKRRVPRGSCGPRDRVADPRAPARGHRARAAPVRDGVARERSGVRRRSKQVGYATSTWSPLLKRYIALAHLEAAAAKPGRSSSSRSQSSIAVSAARRASPSSHSSIRASGRARREAHRGTL